MYGEFFECSKYLMNNRRYETEQWFTCTHDKIVFINPSGLEKTQISYTSSPFATPQYLSIDINSQAFSL